MGLLTQTSHTMVAAKLLISLCVAGISSAAPQNQGAIVSDVVVALQPSIAAAVAEALRGLGGSSSTTRVATSSTGFSSGSSASGFSSSSSSRGSVSSSAASARAAEPTARPEYSFEYKVADDVEKTYISQSESRDGDDVVGTYSYVDPNGDLITVNYQAGLDGYTQTLDKQVGAVQIRAQPARDSTSQSSFAGQTSSSGSSSFGSGSSGSSSFGSSSFGSSSVGSSSAGLNQSDLIAQIISALRPQISAAVN